MSSRSTRAIVGLFAALTVAAGATSAAAFGPTHSDGRVRLTVGGPAVVTAELDGSLVELPLRLPVGELSAADAAQATVRLQRGDRPVGRSAGAVTVTATQVPRATPAPGAAQQPAGVARPGSIVTVAGGYCDGYAPSQATLSPTRVSYVDGRLTWVDDDGSWTPGDNGQAAGQFNGPAGGGFSTPFLGKHTRGSFLVRQVRNGRVQTRGPLLEPEGGEIQRQEFFSSYLSDAQPGARGQLLVNINNNVFRTKSEGPGSGLSRIEAWTASGRRLLVGGGTFTESQFGKTDDQPVDHTGLGWVQTFVRDGRGNIFLAESTSPDPMRGDVLLRYANLGARPVTFYRGTPWQLVVAPRTIRTIAGRLRSASAPRQIAEAVTGPPPAPTPALDSVFAKVPRLRIRGDLLYLLDVTSVAGNATGGVMVRAINLGMAAGAGPAAISRVNGVLVPNGYVATLAGAAEPTGNSAGDGGPARAAQFAVRTTDFSGDFEVAANADLYVAEPLGNRIRRVDDLGLVSTVAGDGVGGYGGDGGPGTAARLWAPTGITNGPDGSIVIADLMNGRIRQLDRAGTIRTIAGRGPTPCGDGQWATGQTRYGGAYFGLLRGMATDQRGDVFVADGAYNIVRRISPDGRVTAQIGRPMPCVVNDDFQHDSCPLLGDQSGDGGDYKAASLAEPHFVAADTYNNVYISDFDRIRYVNLQDRAVSVHGRWVAPHTIVTLRQFPGRTVGVDLRVRGRPVYRGQVPLPLGDVAVDGNGNLFIADPVLHRIYRLDSCGNFSVFAGTGRMSGAGAASQRGSEADYRDGDLAANANVNPSALAFDRTRNALLVVDSNASGGDQSGGLRVRAISLARSRQVIVGRLIGPLHIDTIAGRGTGGSFGDGGPAYDASIAGVSTIGVGPDGRIYLAESMDARVRVILPDGRIGNVAGPWREREGVLDQYHWGDSGDGGPAQRAWMLLWSKISGWNNYLGAMGFLTVDPWGNVLVADHASGRVRKIVRPDLAPVRFGDPPAPDELALPRDFADQRFLPQIETSTLRPRLADGARYVTAGKGNLRGCAIWRRDPLGRTGDDPTVNVGGVADRDQAPSGVGGVDCQVALGPQGDRLVAAAPVTDTGSPTGALSALQVSTSTDAGMTWQRVALPLADDAVAGADGHPMLGSTGLPPGLPGILAAAAPTTGPFSLVYPAVDGRLRLLASTDGLRWLPAGSIPAPGASRVSPVVSGHDVSAVAFLTGSTTVNVATSVHGGPWQTSARWQSARSAALVSRPAVAVDDGGSLYVTWSDDQQVFVASHPAGGSRWTAPQPVAATRVGLLPSMVAGAPGRVAIAYLGSDSPKVRDGDAPQADWYPIVTHLRATGTGALRPVHSTKASRRAVAFGPLCLAVTCTSRDVGFVVAADLTPALAADSRGRVSVAYTTQTGPRDILGVRVSVTTACRGESLRGPRLPDTCRSRDSIASYPVVGSGTPAVPIPAVPALLLPCSPLPPAYSTTPVQQHQPQPSHRLPHTERLVPPALTVPLVPQAPMQPALPPQAGTAPGTQVNQAQAQQQQTSTQTQIGQQLGIATQMEEKRSAARATTYSYRRPAPTPSVPILWLVVGVTVGAAGLRGRRGRPATCAVAIHKAGRR